MFKKILFPTDGSEYSKRAAIIVAELASKFNAEVILLHCQYIPIQYSPYIIPNPELEKDILDIGKNILKETEEILEKTDIHPVGFLKEGSAGPMIIKTAEEENCDSITMGFRGLGAMGSMLSGSVSNYVIHHTKLPVMLIH
jgi:nucleotide-binding universal stress UspA family protein